MKPDYSEYSISELQDALASINREAYPERVNELESELASRQADVSHKEDDTNPGFKKFVAVMSRIFLFCIGLVTFWYGMHGFSEGEISGKHDRVWRLAENPKAFYFFTFLSMFVGVYLIYISIFGRKRD